MILEMSVANNTTLATLQTISNWGLLDFRKEREVATSWSSGSE